MPLPKTSSEDLERITYVKQFNMVLNTEDVHISR